MADSDCPLRVEAGSITRLLSISNSLLRPPLLAVLPDMAMRYNPVDEPDKLSGASHAPSFGYCAVPHQHRSLLLPDTFRCACLWQRSMLEQVLMALCVKARQREMACFIVRCM